MMSVKTAAAVLMAASVGGLGVMLQAQAGADRAPRVERFDSRGSEIGVSIRDVTADAKPGAGPVGVSIEEVTPDGPAAKAGIKKEDVIVEFDGERVRSVRQFMRLVHETPPGRPVAATLVRAGARMNVTVEPRAASGFRLLGELARSEVLRNLGEDFATMFPPAPPAPPPAPGAPPAPPAPPRWPDVQPFLYRSEQVIGITVAPLSDQLAEYFAVKSGVLVTAVQDKSAAQVAGFRAGDVLTALNGAGISEPADLRRRTQRLEEGTEFTAEIVRGKKPLTLKGRVERRTGRAVTRVAV